MLSGSLMCVTWYRQGFCGDLCAGACADGCEGRLIPLKLLDLLGKELEEGRHRGATGVVDMPLRVQPSRNISS